MRRPPWILRSFEGQRRARELRLGCSSCGTGDVGLGKGDLGDGERELGVDVLVSGVDAGEMAL
jgi:hypothetical protein